MKMSTGIRVVGWGAVALSLGCQDPGSPESNPSIPPVLAPGSQVAAPTAALTSVAFGSVFAGGAHTCALTATGAAYCWGRGESGQLGVPPPTTTCMTDAGAYPCSKIPVQTAGGLIFTKLAGGGAHTCGLTGDGSAYCWGKNDRGQLGDNSTTNRNAPV